MQQSMALYTHHHSSCIRIEQSLSCWSLQTKEQAHSTKTFAQVSLLMLLIVQVKPISKTTSGGCQTINVETYGGGLWYTWFDRDLGIAGRVLVRQQQEAAAEGSNGSGKLQHRLVKIDKPVLRIPMLAIHLSRNM
jgi:aspartyl aminopeptidase